MSTRISSYLAAVALALMAIAIAQQEWNFYRLESRLKAGGVVTQGVVHSIRLDKLESVALVEYALPDEGVRIREIPVSRPFAHWVRASDQPRQVKVRYLTQDHKVVDILGASQVSRWSILMSLVLFALSAWMFRRARRADS